MLSATWDAHIKALGSLLLVMLPSPLLSGVHTLVHHTRVARDQPHFELARDGHQRGLELVVVDVVGVGRAVLAGDDPVRGQDADQRRVEQPGGDELAGAGARACAEAQVSESVGVCFGRRVDGLEPSLGIELAAVGAEMVNVFFSTRLDD